MKPKEFVLAIKTFANQPAKDGLITTALALGFRVEAMNMASRWNTEVARFVAGSNPEVSCEDLLENLFELVIAPNAGIAVDVEDEDDGDNGSDQVGDNRGIHSPDTGRDDRSGNADSAPADPGNRE